MENQDIKTPTTKETKQTNEPDKIFYEELLMEQM